MIVADIFRALGDPIRLEMVQRLSDGLPQNITSVSQGLMITRQGARKHLQILADTDLISLQSQGRDTYVQLNRDTLERSKVFITELEKRWDKRLEALKKFVES